MEITVKCGSVVDMPVPKMREYLFQSPSFLGRDVFPNALSGSLIRSVNQLLSQLLWNFSTYNLHSFLIPYFSPWLDTALLLVLTGTLHCHCPSLLVVLKC